MSLRLLVAEGQGSERAHELDGTRISIGRRPDNDVVLGHREVSGRHAMIERRDRQWVLVDQRSTNRTFIDGEPIAPETPFPLNHGDVIGIGPFRLRLDLGEGGFTDSEMTIASSVPSGRSVDELLDEMARAWARAIDKPPAERVVAVRRALAARTDGIAPAQRVTLLSELRQRAAPADDGADTEDVQAELYPAAWRAVLHLSQRLLGEQSFATAEEVDRFGRLLAEFVDVTCRWLGRAAREQGAQAQLGATAAPRGEAVAASSGLGDSTEAVARRLLDWADHGKDEHETAARLAEFLRAADTRRLPSAEGLQVFLGALHELLAPDRVEEEARRVAGSIGAPGVALAARSRLWDVFRARWLDLRSPRRMYEDVVRPRLDTYVRIEARADDADAETRALDPGELPPGG